MHDRVGVRLGGAVDVERLPGPEPDHRDLGAAGAERPPLHQATAASGGSAAWRAGCGSATQLAAAANSTNAGTIIDQRIAETKA